MIVRTAVAKGHVIERQDLGSGSVSGVGGVILVADLASVVGHVAAVDLLPGQVLTAAAVTDSALPGQGEAMIGLSLDSTRVPAASLEPGDRVDAIAVPSVPDGAAAPDGSDLDAPDVLARSAYVYAATGGSATGSELQVTLLVARDEASRVAAYSTQNRVALIETSVDEEAAE